MREGGVMREKRRVVCKKPKGVETGKKINGKITKRQNGRLSQT